MPSRSPSDLKALYRLVRIGAEGPLPPPPDDERCEDVPDKELRRLSKKLRAMIPEEDAEEMGRKMMMHRYGGFSDGPDEMVCSIMPRAPKKRLTLASDYFSPDREELTRREVGIYCLSRGYVTAFCRLRGEMRKSRVDRFVTAKVTKKRYSVPADLDRKEYLWSRQSSSVSVHYRFHFS